MPYNIKITTQDIIVGAERADDHLGLLYRGPGFKAENLHFFPLFSFVRVPDRCYGQNAKYNRISDLDPKINITSHPNNKFPELTLSIFII